VQSQLLSDLSVETEGKAREAIRHCWYGNNVQTNYSKYIPYNNSTRFPSSWLGVSPTHAGKKNDIGPLSARGHRPSPQAHPCEVLSCIQACSRRVRGGCGLARGVWVSVLGGAHKQRRKTPPGTRPPQKTRFVHDTVCNNCSHPHTAKHLTVTHTPDPRRARAAT